MTNQTPARLAPVHPDLAALADPTGSLSTFCSVEYYDVTRDRWLSEAQGSSAQWLHDEAMALALAHGRARVRSLPYRAVLAEYDACGEEALTLWAVDAAERATDAWWAALDRPGVTEEEMDAMCPDTVDAVIRALDAVGRCCGRYPAVDAAYASSTFSWRVAHRDRPAEVTSPTWSETASTMPEL